MAVTVEHNLALPAGPPCVQHEVLRLWLISQARFTVIDSGLHGVNGAWLVVKNTGGTKELFIGAASATLAAVWHVDNILDTYDDDDWYYALSPSGGWDSASDDPTTSLTMFKDAANFGGTLPSPRSGWWGQIRLVPELVNAAAASYVTIIDDPDDDLICLLFDSTRNGIWNGIILMVGYDVASNIEALDPYRAIVFAGIPKKSSVTSSAIYEYHATQMSVPLYNRGTLLGPPLIDVSPVSHLLPWCPQTSNLLAAAEPSPFFPAANNWTTQRIPIATDHANSRAFRGWVKSSVRQVCPDIANRQLLGASGEFISPYLNAGFVLPWDGSAPI
jgi:hypothetical protein